MKIVRVRNVAFGRKHTLPLVAGPCVAESRDICMAIAERLVKISKKLDIPLVFKASYDKANRSSIASYRGPGLKKGLEILEEIREKFDIPILTDVHSPEEAKIVGRVVDILQIPAFLCRQTDLIVAAGETGRIVNVKKAQFMSPYDMLNIVTKLETTGNTKILLTERGTAFGYNNLVSDMRSIPQMQEFNYPVIFDATHSVQKPGGGGTCSSGDGYLAPYLAKAAVAVGANGLFVETHTDVTKALSDKDNMIPLDQLEKLMRQLQQINAIV
jgi:2-dehydro-3-deoxyphosphooctonate aldolase (KDO 8-P synthase)